MGGTTPPGRFPAAGVALTGCEVLLRLLMAFWTGLAPLPPTADDSFRLGAASAGALSFYDGSSVCGASTFGSLAVELRKVEGNRV